MQQKLINRKAALNQREQQRLLDLLIGYLGENTEFEKAMAWGLDMVEAITRRQDGGVSCL